MRKPRHYLKVSDLTAKEILKVIEQSIVFKKNRKQSSKKKLQNQVHRRLPLNNHILGLLFQKSSTRTRVSFEVGIRELGGTSLFLDEHSIQLGRGEPLLDTLKVLERYLHGMVIRNHDHSSLQMVSEVVRFPVINGLTEKHHPCQALADALTIYQNVKSASPRIAYVGEGNNVSISLIEICSLLQWQLTVASPKGYRITDKMLEQCFVDPKWITFTQDPVKAVQGAHVIYTDTWYSMGDTVKKNVKRKIFSDYRVDAKLVEHAHDDYVFLHCLPAYRGEEVSKDIIDGPHSTIFDQAENRLHVQKALLQFFFK